MALTDNETQLLESVLLDLSEAVPEGTRPFRANGHKYKYKDIKYLLDAKHPKSLWDRMTIRRLGHSPRNEKKIDAMLDDCEAEAAKAGGMKAYISQLRVLHGRYAARKAAMPPEPEPDVETKAASRPKASPSNGWRKIKKLLLVGALGTAGVYGVGVYAQHKGEHQRDGEPGAAPSGLVETAPPKAPAVVEEQNGPDLATRVAEVEAYVKANELDVTLDRTKMFTARADRTSCIAAPKEKVSFCSDKGKTVIVQGTEP